MKNLGLSAVIFISFLLIFIQTAGSFYCKSFSGFSYVGLIIYNHINANVIIITTWFTSIIFLICSYRNKNFMYTSMFSIFITMGFSIFKNYNLTDCILSIFFCIIIFIRSIMLIKDILLDYNKK
jgi:hypothetical protein